MVSTYRGHGTLSKYLAENFDFFDIGYQFPGRYKGDELVYCNKYSKGKLVSSKDFGRSSSGFLIAMQRLHPMLLHIPIILIVFYAVIKNHVKYDLFIIGGLSPITMLLKVMGIANRVIMISCDAYFLEGNFISKMIHSVEIGLEAKLQNTVNEVWYVSSRLQRRSRAIIRNQNVVRRVVPYCVDLKWLNWRLTQALERHSLVYFGAVVPGRGLELIIDSLLRVVRLVPDVKFRIVGEGISEYEKSLRNRVLRLGLSDNVEFVRFGNKVEDNPKKVATCAIGMAIYDSFQKSILYTDSIKVKEYLGCGLPVIISRRLPFSEEIETEGAGSAVSNDEKMIGMLIVRYLTDDSFFREKSEGAIKFARRFDYVSVYDSVFQTGMN